MAISNTPVAEQRHSKKNAIRHDVKIKPTINKCPSILNNLRDLERPASVNDNHSWKRSLQLILLTCSASLRMKNERASKYANLS